MEWRDVQGEGARWWVLLKAWLGEVAASCWLVFVGVLGGVVVVVAVLGLQLEEALWQVVVFWR
jgi:flagellar biosynthesis component FlhA